MRLQLEDKVLVKDGTFAGDQGIIKDMYDTPAGFIAEIRIYEPQHLSGMRIKEDIDNLRLVTEPLLHNSLKVIDGGKQDNPFKIHYQIEIKDHIHTLSHAEIKQLKTLLGSIIND